MWDNKVQIPLEVTECDFLAINLIVFLFMPGANSNSLLGGQNSLHVLANGLNYLQCIILKKKD